MNEDKEWSISKIINKKKINEKFLFFNKKNIEKILSEYNKKTNSRLEDEEIKTKLNELEKNIKNIFYKELNVNGYIYSNNKIINGKSTNMKLKIILLKNNLYWLINVLSAYLFGNNDIFEKKVNELAIELGLSTNKKKESPNKEKDKTISTIKNKIKEEKYFNCLFPYNEKENGFINKISVEIIKIWILRNVLFKGFKNINDGYTYFIEKEESNNNLNNLFFLEIIVSLFLLSYSFLENSNSLILGQFKSILISDLKVDDDLILLLDSIYKVTILEKKQALNSKIPKYSPDNFDFEKFNTKIKKIIIDNLNLKSNNLTEDNLEEKFRNELKFRNFFYKVAYLFYLPAKKFKGNQYNNEVTKVFLNDLLNKFGLINEGKDEKDKTNFENINNSLRHELLNEKHYLNFENIINEWNKKIINENQFKHKKILQGLKNKKNIEENFKELIFNSTTEKNHYPIYDKNRELENRLKKYKDHYAVKNKKNINDISNIELYFAIYIETINSIISRAIKNYNSSLISPSLKQKFVFSKFYNLNEYEHLSEKYFVFDSKRELNKNIFNSSYTKFLDSKINFLSDEEKDELYNEIHTKINDVIENNKSQEVIKNQKYKVEILLQDERESNLKTSPSYNYFLEGNHFNKDDYNNNHFEMFKRNTIANFNNHLAKYYKDHFPNSNNDEIKNGKDKIKNILERKISSFHKIDNLIKDEKGIKFKIDENINIKIVRNKKINSLFAYKYYFPEIEMAFYLIEDNAILEFLRETNELFNKCTEELMDQEVKEWILDGIINDLRDYEFDNFRFDINNKGNPVFYLIDSEGNKKGDYFKLTDLDNKLKTTSINKRVFYQAFNEILVNNIRGFGFEIIEEDIKSNIWKLGFQISFKTKSFNKNDKLKRLTLKLSINPNMKYSFNIPYQNEIELKTFEEYKEFLISKKPKAVERKEFAKIIYSKAKRIQEKQIDNKATSRQKEFDRLLKEDVKKISDRIDTMNLFKVVKNKSYFKFKKLSDNQIIEILNLMSDIYS